MPRSNIPYRSMRNFSNRKRTSFSRAYRPSDTRLSDSQQGSSCPVNNILVFPKNSETTINVLGNNSLPYGNLLKKIKGRKRKEKQRLKKKHSFEDDVKPVINKVKPSGTEKMKPKMNKHIIFLSDSDNENTEVDHCGDSSVLSDTIAKSNHENDEDDDVIFVETPAAEIIEIDDVTDQIEVSKETSVSSNVLEKSCDQVNSVDVNDFLDNSHISLKSQFNFELHGSEFKGAEFLKPSTITKDMSESGSVSSISDVSATIGMNVFNVVDFPQEKVNLFDDNNMEKFRNAITPQRPNKKSKNFDGFDSSEQLGNQHDNLPTLYDIQVEDNTRKQRGRSIIKELVNDRAYVLLSAAEKKFKNKKRKSKDGMSDTLEEEGQNDDIQELNKKKKKKKIKKRDASPNKTNLDRSRIDIVDEKHKKRKEGRGENTDESPKYSIAIRTDLFEPADSEIQTHVQKSKKKKCLDSDSQNDAEDSEKKKKKNKKNLEETLDDVTKKKKNEEQCGETTEDNEEKRKKKNKRTSEYKMDQQGTEEIFIEENSEEKKKKKSKRNAGVSIDVSAETNHIELQQNVAYVQEENEEKKKKRGRRISEVSSEFSVEKKKSEKQCINYEIPENNEEKRRKKNRKSSTTFEKVEGCIEQNIIIGVEEISEETRKIMEQIEMKVSVHDQPGQPDIGKGLPENTEEKRKKKIRKTPTTSEKDDGLDQSIIRFEEIPEERINIMKQIEMKEPEYTQICQEHMEKDHSENIEEKRKRRTKKDTELSNQINPGENGNLIPYVKLKILDINEYSKEKSETIQNERTKTNEEAFGKIVENQEKRKVEKTASIVIDNKNHETICQDIQMVQVGDGTSITNSVLINNPDDTENETLPRSSIDVPKKNEETSRLNTKRTCEPLENIVKKPKVEEHNTETVVSGCIKEGTKVYEELQEISMEKNGDEMEVQNRNIANNTQEQHIESTKYTENISDAPLENSFDSLRKRKNETSMSETIHNPAESIRPKRMKIVADILHSTLIENCTDNQERKNQENRIEEEFVDEISSKKDDNVSMAVMGEETLEEHRITENVENNQRETVENLEIHKCENPMLIIDNEGNIDMKLTHVFTSGNNSIFPDEVSFTDDVNLDNFADKNSSWSADSSRFYSYNASLFNNVNRQDSSEINNETPHLESNSVVTATSSELLESRSNQNSLTEPVIPSDSPLNNLNEKIAEIVVKNENEIGNDPAPSENTADIVSQEIVTVKTEKESEDVARTTIDQRDRINHELKQNPSHSVLETDTTPSKILDQLPNEIEEIVKEKDNLDTVKKLCQFLEEARDPSDVLKKVSLLKEAFIEKSQNSAVLNEEVRITYDNDDVFSISSSGSSVLCLEDDVSVVSIEDDIILANCDLTEGGKNANETDEIIENPAGSSSNPNVNIIDSIVKPSDKIENAACTSQSVINSTSIPSETLHIKKGLDKFEVEDIQSNMSSDPKLWKVVAEDIYPLQIPTKRKRCIKCKEIGHLGYNCPNKLNLPKCSLCGLEGHLDFRCPNKLCTQCGRKAPEMQHVCDHCKHYRNLTCVLCKNKGHPRNKCPDLWRRYHLTVNHGPLVKGDTLQLKKKENLWCSSCAQSGHVESQCDISSRKRKNFQPLDPRIHHYVDVYNIKPTVSGLDSVLPNIDEVPSTSQHFLNNDDSSSSSSSDSSDDDVDNAGPADTSIPPNNTCQEDEFIENTEEGLEDLPSDFVVIDETIEDHQLTGLSISNQKNRDYFMTATIKSLKEFLTEELSVLECSKFKIQDIDRRFYAYREDDKKPVHKARFAVECKEVFYKELNMLLFGKLQIKCAHKDKLKDFVNSSVDTIPDSMRESLCYSYDYIFRNRPHDQVNYRIFLRMLRRTYGNQPWIY